MSKNKPSFLQRLTGAVVEEEGEREQMVPLNSKPEMEEIQQNYQEEKKVIKSGGKEKENASIVKENIDIEAKKDETWLSESEGQLTIDVFQTPANIVIQSTIAGVKPDDVDITITNDTVTIKGERKNEEIIKEEDYYYQECYWGKFSRSVILPVDVISEKTEASMKNGILTIILPKAEQLRTKKIRIKSI
ncbi:MAG: hypothetical protein US76_02305 [Parcubacteria group bacterium GW2011_GWA2_38_13b]|nr:MAG: hypothetical protein US76_02305 [Parcubacteria group bacterium GW2011_GWA2_38_13b]